MKTSTLLLLSFLTSSLVLAPGAESAAATTETSTSTLEKKSSSGPSRSQIILGIKSTNDTGRFAVLNDNAKSPSKGLTLNGKQEIFAGYKMRNNWGAFVQMTQYRREFNEPTLNKWVVADPSLSLIHPDLYQSDSLTIKGLFRAYAPYTDRSKSQNIRQYAYYSTQILKIANGAEINNQLIPRLFAADQYQDLDKRLYLEDRTTYTQSINSWSRWGIGQWAQVEQHANAGTGYCLEIIPQLDFVINPTTFVGPRVALPVFSQNYVYDGPQGASLDEARAELYFQMSL